MSRLAPPLARTRRVYLALSWLPPAAFIAGVVALNRLEGWGGLMAAGAVVPPLFLLSAAMSGAGVLLLVLRRRYDPWLMAAILLSGSALGFVYGGELFR